MHDAVIRILLIEDNMGDARLMRENLHEAGNSHFTIAHAQRLGEGLQLLESHDYDVVLLDLALPDSMGLETVTQTNNHAANVPIVVLTGSEDENLGMQAVQAGAQDYLIKNQAGSSQIIRSLRYAIERHRMQSEVRACSLVDELTGLYNRRGFLALTEQMMKAGQRNNQGMSLLFADVNGLKQINDLLGHQAGDHALCQAGAVLRKTFRESDVIGRLGGDEFAVAAPETPLFDPSALKKRLRANVAAVNRSETRLYSLSMSIGMVHWNPMDESSLEGLLAQADELMYEDKRRSKRNALAIVRTAY